MNSKEKYNREVREGEVTKEAAESNRPEFDVPDQVINKKRSFKEDDQKGDKKMKLDF